MMLGEDQHAALVAALRNQPAYPHIAAAPSAQSIMNNADTLAKGYQDIKAAGKSDAQQYADEFGGHDVAFKALQNQQPDEGDFMKGLQNKWNGLFGGASG
jgi:hypothetical protein